MTTETVTLPATSDLPAEVHPVQAILRFLRVVRYRRGVVIAALVVSCLLGGLYYATTPPKFESKASLLVVQTGENADSTGMWQESMNTQLMFTCRQVVQSDKVLKEAIKKLRPEHCADFQEVRPAKWVDGVPPRECVDIVKSNCTVTALRNTTVLEVAYRSRDPRAAAAVVDAILSAYMEYMTSLQKMAAEEIRGLLTMEKEDNEAKLAEAENEVLKIKSEVGILVSQGVEQDFNVFVDRVRKFNQDWMTAEEERQKAIGQYRAIEEAIRNGGDLRQSAVTMSDSLTSEVLDWVRGRNSTSSYMLAQVERDLVENKARLQSDLEILGPQHPRVLESQYRIRQAEAVRVDQISDRELGPILLGIAGQRCEMAIERERASAEMYTLADAEAKKLNGPMGQLDQLENKVGRLRAWDGVLLERLKNIEIVQGNDILRISALDTPKVPSGPIWPSLKKVMLLAILMGLAAGLAIVYVQDLLDDHFRSAEELRTQLGIPVLAMIGKLGALEAKTGIDAVHVHVAPEAVETEAFRTLRTALSLAQDSTRGLVMSSSEPGDGKTTVVVNLATVFAQSGKRTLLIDADMRRPGLSSLLDLRGYPGLSTVLREKEPVTQVAQSVLNQSMSTNLDVISSGPRPTNPTELLSSDRFSELLAWAETRYDQILIDSPPALVSDTAIIGRLVDGVLLVVQPHKNRRRVVVRAAESFPSLGIKLLGIVPNCLAPESDKGYYGYGYGYGYGYSYGAEEDSPGEDTPTKPLIHPSKRATRRVA